MKKLVLFFGLFLALSSSFGLKAQNDWSALAVSPQKEYSDITEKERIHINEVFGDQAQSLVWDASKSDFKNALIKLLRERISFVNVSDLKKQKETTMLKKNGLSDDFNKTLKLDKSIDIENFNPLKYRLDFFSNGTYLYKIDNTPYYLQVESQHRKKL